MISKLSIPNLIQTRLAITNVTVILMDQHRILPNQTVVIHDGWIESIDHAGNINTDNMHVVDGTDKYLLPGLADMHVHYWMPGDAALFFANGVTTVRNMSGAPFHLAWQKQVNEGNYPGPRMVTTSPTMEAEDFMLPMWKFLDDPAQAEPLVEAYVARGYQQIKVLNFLRDDVVQSLGKACQKHGVRLTGHCPHTMTFEDGIAAGMTCFEHLLGVWKGHTVLSASEERSLRAKAGLSLDVLETSAYHVDDAAIRRLAGQMAEPQIWNCPTLVTDICRKPMV